MDSSILNTIYEELFIDLQFFLFGGLLGTIYFLFYFIKDKKKKKSKKS